LKQTMEMYSTACKEALTAKQKVRVSVKTSVYGFQKSKTCFGNCRRLSFNVGS